MKNDNIFKILSIIVITFILLLFYSKIHQCNWDYCPHEGKLMISSNFISYWGYEEDTDGNVMRYVPIHCEKFSASKLTLMFLRNEKN